MSKTWILIALGVSAFAARQAHADSRAYVSVGGELGGSNGALDTAVSIGGGYQIQRGRPLFVHVQVADGTFDDLSEAVGSESSFQQGSGHYVQVRAGLESSSCTASGTLCGLYGADLGVMRTSESSGPLVGSPSSRYTKEQLIPRAGVDFGGEHLRLRVMAELSLGMTQRDSMSTTTSESGMQGISLGAAVAYRF